MELTVTAAPTADAGSNEEICEGSSLDLGTSSSEPSASNYSSLSWDDDGVGGTFGDNTALKPVYTPPAGYSGTITLTLTANGNGTCAPATDNMELTVTAAPSADAGSDEETCENTSFNLSSSATPPSASDYSSLSWDDGGAGGSFDDNTALQPVYTPPTDYSGSITLTLTANGNGSCDPVTDNMELTVTAAPSADAGSDEETCENTIFDLSTSSTEPSASDYSSLSWNDGGIGGSFSDNTALKPAYTPPADYTGTITLTLTANGNGSCAPATDNMELTVAAEPTVDAGSDEETCEGNNFDLSTSATTPTASDYSSLSWDDGGVGGSFDDNTSLTPVYTPPAGFSGTITLTLTADGNANCGAVSDNMELTVTPEPSANAGSDEETCENTSFDLSASATPPSASDYSSLTWDDGGIGGSFDDNTALQPVYTPPADYNGSITLTLTANGNGSCAPATDNMELTVYEAPDVDAGSNEETCEDVSFDLSSSTTQPTASDYSSLTWDDGGVGGSFDDNTALRPVYTPPAGYSGTITLTLTAGGNANCGDVSDNMELTVTEAPEANAGSNEETCEGTLFDLGTSSTTPTASDYSSLTWDDGGAGGSFDDNTLLEPVYTPPAGFSGTITLTLTANGNGSCAPATDYMELTVTEAPTADAGQDTVTICYGDSVYLDNADTSNASSVNWTTSGDGSFSDPNVIHPSYEPGFEDKNNGSVTLYLEAGGNGSCNAVMDSIEVIIPPEVIASIGSPRPFLIDQNTTEVSVSIKVENHDYIEDLSYFLVSPNGNKLRLASSKSCWTFLTGTDLTFTSTAADTFDVCNDPVTGTYKLSGDLSSIDGEDPANGAWRIRVEDDIPYTTNDYEGIITEASIQFTDNHHSTGEPVTIVYDGKNIDKPIREYSGIAGDPPAGTDYTVPYGLETTCYGSCDATAVVFKFGGTPPYTSVEWKDTTGTVISTADTVDLCAGKYYVEITDALGCTGIDSVTVTQPPEIVFDSMEVTSIIDNNGCYEDSSGFVEAGAHGGTGTLEYTLIDTSDIPFDTLATNNSGDFYNLPAGNYLLEVFDQRGCLKDSSFSIVQPDSIAIQYESFTSMTDTGASDGTIDIYAEGGTDSLTYTLYDTIPEPDEIDSVITVQPGDTAYFTDLEEGVYYAEVTDTNGCGPAVSRYFPISAIEVSMDADSVLCAGSNTGTAYAEVTGGVLPYTYEWTNLDTLTMTEDSLRVLSDTLLNNDTLRDISTGRYILNIIDSTGINVRDSVNVYEPDSIAVDSITPDSSITCHGTQETFVAHISGGIKPYEVTWLEKNTLDTVAKKDTAMLTAGSYYIDVVDANDCYWRDSVTITQPDSIAIQYESFTSMTDTGASDGTIDIYAEGGTDSLTYTLYDTIPEPDEIDSVITVQPGDTAYFTGLEEGVYYAEVTDTNGCGPAVSRYFPISAIEVSMDADSVLCAGSNTGTAYAEVTGGVLPYTYEWTTLDTVTMTEDTLRVLRDTLLNNDTLRDISAGRYILNIIDSTGINVRDSVNVYEPDSIAVDSITPDSSITCHGTQETFVAHISGGIKPYEVTWLEKNTLDTVAKKDTALLSAGTYYIDITDRNNCYKRDSVTITQPDSLRITGEDFTPLTSTGASDGSIDIDAAGGNPPLKYMLYRFTSTDTTGIDTTSNGEFAGLARGDYFVLVTDAIGCDTVKSSDILIRALAIEFRIDSVTCAGNGDGSIIAEIISGFEPFTYEWTSYSGDTLRVKSTSESTDTLSGIDGGRYVLNVIDNTNNNNRDTAFLYEPNPLEFYEIVPDTLSGPGQSDGSLAITVTGGNDSIFYEIDNLEDFFGPSRDTLQNLNDTTKKQFVGLSEGLYGITVYDENGCGNIKDTVEVTYFDLDLDKNDIACNGQTNGMAIAQVSGGTPPFTYNWSDTTVTDSSRTDTLKNLAAGWYHVTVTDHNGFSLKDSVEVIEPDPLQVTLEDTLSVPCNGSLDSFSLAVNGGTAPYDIDWLDETMDSVATGDTVELGAGNYYISIADSNNCSIMDSVYIEEPNSIQIDSINLIPHTPNYTLEVWATGGNDSLYLSIASQDTTFKPDSGFYRNDTTVAVFDSLSAGTYTITATDTFGCGPDEVTLSFPLDVNLSIADSIDCPGDSNGAVSVEVEGGKPEYTYEWSNGDEHVHNQKTDAIYDLSSGTYSITVTDRFGLTAVGSINLPEPEPIVANPMIRQANCASDHEPLEGEDVGYIRLNPSGGTAYTHPDYSYRYYWSNETDTLPGRDSLMNISGGSYQVTIIDRNGCEMTTSINVPQATEYMIDLEFGGVVDTVCYGDRVNLFVESAQNADSLNWMNTPAGYSIPEELDTLSETLTSEQTYTIEAKNSKCRYIDSLNIGLYPHLGIQINEEDEEQDGKIRVKENVTGKSLSATVMNSEVQATYSWQPEEYFDPADSLITELQVNRLRQQEIASQNIWIVATTEHCTELDSATVMMIPNVKPLDAFSPNDDNINDTWRIMYAEQYDKIEVVVFNRWGVEVFRQKPYRNDNGWDGTNSNGKKLPSGTYYYIINTHESGIQPLSGTVTIIR
jgi:gliding motility-associated-like protein